MSTETTPPTENGAVPSAVVNYQHWIDWLKLLGMAIVLGGHTGMDDLIGPRFNPINPKQLGVAFFVFITGYSLANHASAPLQTFLRRYSPVFVYGLFLALIFSCCSWWIRSDLAESNYLPFIGGLNTFFENAFPANPSTWYIGTYFQLLVIWALLLRHLTPSWSWFFALMVLEISVRSLWMSFGRDFNAYMSFTSWLPALMAGMILGRDQADPSARAGAFSLSAFLSKPGTMIFGGVLFLGFLFLWSQVVQSYGISKKNPFGRIPTESPLLSTVLTSMSVTLLYVVYTTALLSFFYRIECPRWVRFLSRHTLWVFLAHMPVRDIVTPLYYPWIEPGWIRQFVNFLVLFVGLAWTSEALSKWVHLPAVCKFLETKVLGLLGRKEHA